MKNNLFNESLLKVSLLLITITLFLVYSCKKDTGKNSDVELIQMAKEWFSAKPNLSYIPSWDKANVTHLNGHNFVILPSNMSLSSDEIIINSYLAVDISENEIQGNLIELFRTKDSEGDFLNEEVISKYLLYKEKLNGAKDLSINILLFDVNHKFISGSALVNGMTSRKINLLTPKDLMSRLLMGDVGSTRKETCVDYYYVLSDTKSAIVYSATYLYTICAGGGNAGGSGGGGGGESNTSKKKEIINKITDPCLKNTINEALASNKDVKGFLSEVINKFSGLNNGIIINLYNGDINLPAGTSSKLENGVFTANITFKNRHYDDVTKEAVVATLIHEVVHAYLLKTNNAYKALPKEDQHNYLFTNFVKDIAGYLKRQVQYAIY